MDNFLSDVLQCNILPFLMFHEARRISRVCTLFNSVVSGSKSYHEPDEKELQRNVQDWMNTISKYRQSSIDILKIDNEFAFAQRSYLTYFMIFQNYLYGKKPSQFVSLINTRKISLKKASNSLTQREKLIRFICNILEYIIIPIPNHLANCNYLDDHYNAALMTINSVDLSSNKLSNVNVINICQAIIRRYKNKKKYTFLKHLNIGNNKQLNNSCMQILFQTLSTYCPFLKSIDLSYTNISNQTCIFIFQYFINPINYNKLYNGQNYNASRIIHIKLYGTKIDARGIQLLSKSPNPSNKLNLIRLKIYHDKNIFNDNKRKGHYQRNIRDLIQKRRK